MKIVVRLSLLVAILFAIASPVASKNETPRFWSFQGFEMSAQWDRSTNDARQTTLVRLNEFPDMPMISLVYEENISGDMYMDVIRLETEIDPSLLNYSPGTDFTLDVEIQGFYMIDHFDFEDPEQSTWDVYEGNLTLHLDWEFLYSSKSKVGNHSFSSEAGINVSKSYESFGQYSVSGSINGNEFTTSDQARVGTYKYKLQNMYEPATLAKISEVFQEKTGEYQSFSWWGDDTALNILTLTQAALDDPQIALNYIRCDIDPDTQDLACFLFEGYFAATDLIKPTFKNLISRALGNAQGTVSIVEMHGQEMETVDTYETTLAIDIAWTFLTWQHTRSNYRWTEDSMRSHELRVTDSFNGWMNGNLGDFSFADVEASVNQSSTHSTIRK